MDSRLPRHTTQGQGTWLILFSAKAHNVRRCTCVYVHVCTVHGIIKYMHVLCTYVFVYIPWPRLLLVTRLSHVPQGNRTCAYQPCAMHMHNIYILCSCHVGQAEVLMAEPVCNSRASLPLFWLLSSCRYVVLTKIKEM